MAIGIPHEFQILAPNTPMFGEYWAEQIMGEVISPVVKRYTKQIKWVWVTRYVYEHWDKPKGLKDFKIPKKCKVMEQGRLVYRYLILRFAIKEGFDLDPSIKKNVISEILERVKHSNCSCLPRKGRRYDVLGDLGSNRFVVKKNPTVLERVERATQILSFMDATTRLALSGLENNSGQWAPEGALLEVPPINSVHHLFCNSTDIYLQASVYIDNEDYFHLHADCSRSRYG